jgi:hypothetical protein
MGGVIARSVGTAWGVFYRDPDQVIQSRFIESGDLYWMKQFFDSARVVPTANKVQPRAWGALACVYLGQPAS